MKRKGKRDSKKGKTRIENVKKIKKKGEEREGKETKKGEGAKEKNRK